MVRKSLIYINNITSFSKGSLTYVLVSERVEFLEQKVELHIVISNHIILHDKQ